MKLWKGKVKSNANIGKETIRKEQKSMKLKPETEKKNQ